MFVCVFVWAWVLVLVFVCVLCAKWKYPSEVLHFEGLCIICVCVCVCARVRVCVVCVCVCGTCSTPTVWALLRRHSVNPSSASSKAVMFLQFVFSAPVSSERRGWNRRVFQRMRWNITHPWRQRSRRWSDKVYYRSNHTHAGPSTGRLWRRKMEWNL